MPNQPLMPPGANLTTADFTEHPTVKGRLDALKAKFSASNPLIVSDVVDDQFQYVDLVQKGGGVLGIALVGYTYVLEMMGIRFLRLAGTSAGAINTSLMTIIDGKKDVKSTKILESICALDFFNLVDGHPAARWLIKNFLTKTDFAAQIRKIILFVGVLFGLFVAADLLLIGLQYSHPGLFIWGIILFVATGIFLLFINIAVFYILSLLKRLKDSGFGINPGDFFYDWIKQQFQANGVNTVSDLRAKAEAEIPGIRLRPGTIHPEGVDDLRKGNVTFITSELVTQNKIQFPAMCNLFRPAAEIDSLQPAGFVRSSMSIPFFFESYFIADIPADNPEIQKAWMDTFECDTPPGTSRFVDGGVLSNFPINLFYNPKVLVPRLPAFGIDLDDSKPGDKEPNPTGWSLMGYIGRLFNTVRDYYDKDFMLKNRVFQKGIGKIPLSQYNWLNFFLKPEDKIAMFVQGAQTAVDFLENFDWADYKDQRETMQRTIIQRNTQQSSHPNV